MKTGEGKTLTTVLPAYLNSLTGKGVHVITVNEYLTLRNAEWMGKVFEFLGVTVGVNLRELITSGTASLSRIRVRVVVMIRTHEANKSMMYPSNITDSVRIPRISSSL